ncbi:hypothetical protein DFR29_12124 [Tahibacter aquaticus]|uniref:Uncharacterized protein n=1 Tax=Tahibacter aquaticus TaxID=520092 RepID=A0A4R6YLY1_9GAMM|nr:hypothetical protein [Tahibacter aquaticus]TDR38352.1 hypothetical protein DFR29_12124 [Tahibacter aquaticus]
MTRQRTALSTLIVLLLVLWAGFIVHRSPRFPGSLTGGVLAVSGASLIVVFSVFYSAVKRFPALRQAFSKYLSMQQLLSVHVYTGALGAILVLLHTGHRFESNLGIALTSSMLFSVLSGYVGGHLLGRVSVELREKQSLLVQLETAYNAAVDELARKPESPIAPVIPDSPFSFARMRSAIAPKISTSGSERAPGDAAGIASSIAELEYSIRSHERVKRLSSRWLVLHIGTSLVFYVLLALHVWASIHFGLRWFQ